MFWRAPQEIFGTPQSPLFWVSESFRQDIGEISTWKVFFVMKNVTDFRKTVETCVGPRLSRIQKRLIINLKKTCILKETHRTPYWFQYRVILYSDKTANFLRRMQCSNWETRVVWLIQLKQITQCFRSSLLWVWQSITLSSDIFWTPNIYFNEDRMNFKKSTRLEVIL